MLIVRLNDPMRDPQHWSGLIRQGQFAVSHFDYKTGTWRTAMGNYATSAEDEVILLFDSFLEAENYCQKHGEEFPAMFCRIYDHRGTAEGMVAQIFPAEIAKRELGTAAARRKLLNGCLQLLIGTLCVLLDWLWGGPVILGVVIGSKFFTSGLVRSIQGIAGLMGPR